MPISIQPLTTNNLSTYRTHHDFLHYAEFTSVEEYVEALAWAKERSLPVFILANGSNVLFSRRRVQSLVLKNKLEKWMRTLEDGRVEASSSLPVSVLLKHCQTHGLDCCYYLASVPATVGGAIAMNAGRGRSHNQSVFDYLDTVTWWEDGQVRTAAAAEIPRQYRWTPFTGIQTKLILSAVFRFPATTDDSNQIAERLTYTKRVQDHSAPNCGSVFKQSSGRIMSWLRGLRIGSARYSPKTVNWLLNHGESHVPLTWLIRVAKLLHLLFLRRAVIEQIQVR